MQELSQPKKLNDKYGPGQLDPQTGVFTPVEPPVQDELWGILSSIGMEKYYQKLVIHNNLKTYKDYLN